MSKFKIKPIAKEDVVGLITAPTSTRKGKGGELVDSFLAGNHAAGSVTFASTKERNAVTVSANNYIKSAGSPVWIRKQGGATGTDLLLINLDLADDATKAAHASRPRPGRKPTAAKAAAKTAPKRRR